MVIIKFPSGVEWGSLSDRTIDKNATNPDQKLLGHNLSITLRRLLAEIGDRANIRTIWICIGRNRIGLQHRDSDHPSQSGAGIPKSHRIHIRFFVNSITDGHCFVAELVGNSYILEFLLAVIRSCKVKLSRLSDRFSSQIERSGSVSIDLSLLLFFSVGIRSRTFTSR